MKVVEQEGSQPGAVHGAAHHGVTAAEEHAGRHHELRAGCGGTAEAVGDALRLLQQQDAAQDGAVAAVLVLLRGGPHKAHEAQALLCDAVGVRELVLDLLAEPAGEGPVHGGDQRHEGQARHAHERHAPVEVERYASPPSAAGTGAR